MSEALKNIERACETNHIVNTLKHDTELHCTEDTKPGAEVMKSCVALCTAHDHIITFLSFALLKFLQLVGLLESKCGIWTCVHSHMRMLGRTYSHSPESPPHPHRLTLNAIFQSLAPLDTFRDVRWGGQFTLVILSLAKLTLCSTWFCCDLSKWTLITLDPSNLIRIRLPTISDGKTRSSRMESCTAVRVLLLGLFCLLFVWDFRVGFWIILLCDE